MAQQVPRREGGQQSGRDNERGGSRDTDTDDETEPSASTPTRRGRSTPVAKLNMYMRGVAVAALLIVGGVGVYQGRNMLATKETGPKIAKVKPDEEAKPGEGKTGEPAKAATAPPASGYSFSPTEKSPKPAAKSSAPKTSALLAALNKEKEKAGAPASTETNPTGGERKKPGLSGFKFGGKKEEPAENEPAQSDGAYSLNDAEPAPAYESYSDDAPEPPGSGGYSFSDDSAGSVGDDAGDALAVVEEGDGSYGSDPVPPSAGARPDAFSGLRSPPSNSIGDASDALDTQPPTSEIPEREPVRLLPDRTVPRNRLAAEPPAAVDYGQDRDVTPIPAGAPVADSMTGLQTPSIAVEKFAPDEVQVGKPATFEIVVKNVGKVPAYDVTVQDEVPRGTTFRQALPQATQSQAGLLNWKLGVMQPGDERVIELTLVPEMEGEIGSVAQVTFQSKAGSKSIVTQPKLEIRHEGPQQVHAGEVATVRLTITNSGTGAASNLLLASNVPEGFTHEAGSSLETKVNPLRPGESQQINLVMTAVKAGQYEQAFFVEDEDGQVVAQDASQVEIVAPGLDVAIAGPRKRYVERQATHNITIANPGTASARDVDLVAFLPSGFKFVSAAPAEAGGQYDSREHRVVWGIEELVAGASATVQLTTLPVEAGDQKVRVEARSANGLTADFEQLVEVDAVSELPFTIHDMADPIEIGSETAYEIRLANRGAKDATNVAVSVAFPPDLKPLAGEGEVQGTVSKDRVEFTPIPRIAPGQEVIFKVRAQGLRAGDHRIAVSLTSDDQQQPLTREESTRVYADQ